MPITSKNLKPVTRPHKYQPVTPSIIKHVARDILTPTDWLRYYGAVYKLETAKQVLTLCTNTIEANPNRAQLPPEWGVIHLGHRYYIYFKTKSSVIPTPQRPRGRGWNVRIPEGTVDYIRRVIGRKLEWSTVIALASKLEISESHVYRIATRKRRARRPNTSAKSNKVLILPPKSLNPETVKRVFSRLITTNEWLEHIGPRYNISNISYVNQMAAQRPNGPWKKVRASLPAPWHSIRIGASWLIYHNSLAMRTKLLKQNTKKNSRQR